MVARIAEYSDPGDPTIREITLDNNEAQSNHTQLISVSASPSTRETGLVRVTNPLPVAANCRVQVRQTSPFSRTYVDHAWVRLDPGEERSVRFRTESMIGDPTVGATIGDNTRAIYKEPNSVRLTGIAQETRTCDGYVTGGAHVPGSGRAGHPVHRFLRPGRAGAGADRGRRRRLGAGRDRAGHPQPT